MHLKILLWFGLFWACQACSPSTLPDAGQRQVQNGPVSLRFQPARLLTESPLALDIDTPAGWQLHKAVLVGVSMDMPTLPLFFTRTTMSEKQGPEQPGVRWQTQFLLGACADPQMRWRLELLFIDDKGAEQRLSDEFVVYRR